MNPIVKNYDQLFALVKASQDNKSLTNRPASTEPMEALETLILSILQNEDSLDEIKLTLRYSINQLQKAVTALNNVEN